jgi:hypothetical protein
MATPQQFEEALAAVQKGPLHPRHSIACQGYNTHSLARYGDRQGLISCTASVHRAIGLFALGCARNTQDQGSNTKAPPPARCFVTPNLLRAKGSASGLLRRNGDR